MKKLLLTLSLAVVATPIAAATNSLITTNQKYEVVKTIDTVSNINSVDKTSNEVFAIIYLLNINHETLNNWHNAFIQDDKNLSQIISNDLDSFSFSSKLPDSHEFIVKNLTDIMVQIFYEGTAPYNPDPHIGLPPQDVMTFDQGKGITIYVPKFENTFFVDDTSVKSQ